MKTNDMNTAIYPHSAAYAKEHGELEQYRASNRANLQCKEAIEAAVREHFDGMYLSRDAAKDVIETYGIDRVMFVLANTVQLQDWDGRYSPRNKAWAKTIPNDNSDTVRYGYAVNSHPAVLDGFIDLVRMEQMRQPLTAADIQAEAERILRELRAPDVPNSPHGTHYMARISMLKFLWSSSSKVSKFSLERNTVAVKRSSVMARRQRIVAWRTNIFDLGLRKSATPNNERQFHPSLPFSTRIMNCFSLPSVPGTSRLLKSLISSFLVYFASPTFKRIFEAGTPSLARILSSAGFTSVTASSTPAA